MNIHQIVAPFSRYFRGKRMAEFERLFRPGADTSVLDIGGTAQNWEYLQTAPMVLLLNVDAPSNNAGQFEKVQGDGRNLPFKDGQFDIAYSNSVIEHVGSWDDQVAFATELRRVGKSYYVQTPNRHFPVEPHLLMPFAQYFPRWFARKALRWLTPHAWIQRPSQQWVDDFIESTRLLTFAEMKQLFPDAVLVRERLLGMTKSIIAYKCGSSTPD